MCEYKTVLTIVVYDMFMSKKFVYYFIGPFHCLNTNSLEMVFYQLRCKAQIQILLHIKLDSFLLV